jgi:LysW-gamma-L-lysine carboxypeptidase
MNTEDTPETLWGLVSRYSPSGMERPVSEWLTARMFEMGYTHSFIDPVGNAVGVMGYGPRQVILLGHVDTYPGEITPLFLDGYLHGRGSVDAKGSLAAMVDAVSELGPVEGWEFVVIAAVDEERDSTGAWYVVGQYHPDFAVIGEPSGWERITLGYKGNAWAEIRITCPLAHTASRTASACEIAFQVWQKIQNLAEEFNQDRQRIFDQLLPSLREFISEEDGLHAWASLRIDTRLPADLPPQAWYSLLRKNFPSQGSTQIMVNQSRYPIPAFEGGKNNALVRSFLAAIRQSNGNPGFVLKTGTADLNIVAPAWGCPAIAYGPGDSSLDHTPDERLSIQEYHQAVQVYQDALRMLCSLP